MLTVDQTEPAPATATDRVTRKALDAHERFAAQASDDQRPSVTPRQAIITGDLERLRSRGAPWDDVRARISFEEPRDLQFIYQEPRLKRWITSIANASDLVDTVERIGGPLAHQIEWLDEAGVERAPTGTRRAPQLTESDQALLDRFDRYRSIAVLEAELATAQQEKIKHLRWTPAGMDPEVARINRVEIQPRERQRAAAISEAGLTEDSWAIEKTRFQAVFHAHAIRTAHAMLKDSARVVESERRRYSAPSELDALRKDAAPLLQKHREVAELRTAYEAACRRELDTKGIIEAAARLTQAEAELSSLRTKIAEEKDYPILLEPTLDLETLVEADPREARFEIERAADARAASIEKMHEHLDDDTSLVFRMDRAIDAALGSMGLVEGSAGAMLVRAESKRIEENEGAWSGVVATIAIGLGLLTGIGGAIGLGATVLGTSLSVASSFDAIQRYRIDSAASQTSFDRARSLSSKEPSAFWLAVDIAGTVLDVGGFAKTFASLHDAASAALRATSTSALEESRGLIAHLAGQAPSGSVTHSDDLIAATIESVERERARIALIDANPALARELSEQLPALDRSALAGLLNLEDSKRSSVIHACAREPAQIARLGAILDANETAARGLEQLARAVDAASLGELASEIATWRDATRAHRVLATLGDPRVSSTDAAELAHALSARSSASARAEVLEAFVRERLPISREEAAAFARSHGVPIVVNETGTSRDVRVYFVARDGLVDDLRIEIGARATLADLELHRDVVAKVARYRGLLGRASRLVDRVRQGTGRIGMGPGRLSYEARREVEKLPGIIRARERELAGTVTPERIVELERDIAALESQLGHFQRELGEQIDQPGRGVISALDAESYEAQRVRDLTEGWPSFPAVARLDGKSLQEINADEWLKAIFDAHYSSRRTGSNNSPIIYRHDGTTDNVPMLRVQDERLHFVATAAKDPPILLPRGASSAELAKFLGENSQSWLKWRNVLVERGVMSEAEISELMRNIMARKKPPKTVAHLRDALKNATRERLVAHCFDGVQDGAASHARLRAFVSNLNPADQGSIAERWYIEHARRYRGIELEAQPELWTGPAHARVKLDRRPDNLHVRGSELGEVKSTVNGLQTRDIDQINDTMRAMAQIGGVTTIGATQPITNYKLIFTDPRGAYGSAETLNRLLNRNGFTLEVFDTGGTLHILTLKTVENLGCSLEEQLRIWAGL